MVNANVAPILFTAVGIVFIFLGVKTLLRRNKRVTNSPMNPTIRETAPAGPPLERQDDAIYQDNKLVARVVGAEINAEDREINFRELRNSDFLLLPDECQFQKYRIMIQRVEYASRGDKERPEDGRVLRGVVAEILGYREQ